MARMTENDGYHITQSPTDCRSLKIDHIEGINELIDKKLDDVTNHPRHHEKEIMRNFISTYIGSF